MTAVRIGLIVPSSNTVMEPDLQRGLGETATVHSARMHLRDPVTADAERAMLEHAVAAGRDIGSLEPDLVVFGCTSAGSLLGRAGDAELRERLSAEAGAPVVGILDALGTSLRALGARRISLLTPYPEELTRSVEGGLRDDGFEIAAAAGMGVAENVAVGRIEPDAIVDAAGGALVPGSDALAIACTNFRALEVRELLQRRLGVPVVTANSAALDAVARALGAGA